MLFKTTGVWLRQAIASLCLLSLTIVPSTASAQRVSVLPQATTVTGPEAFSCVQGGVTKQCTVAQLGIAAFGQVPNLPTAAALTGTELTSVNQGGAPKSVAVSQVAQGSRIIGDGIQQPSTNATYSAGASGSLTGNYGYNITFVTAQGETAPWTGTPASVALSAQQMNITFIPTGPAGTIARRIYRTVANPTEFKDTYLVGTINDNTTTTYTDNAADNTLGVAAKWVSTNRGYINDGYGVVANVSDQSATLGTGARAGYASAAVGYQALYSVTSGRRNNAFGTYALTGLTTGYENVGLGTHAGQGIVAGAGNTMVGVYAGFGNTAGVGTYNFNTGIGNGALYGTSSGLGSQGTAIGYHALYGINTADLVLGLGSYAGAHANASRQLFIDSGGSRASLAAEQDQGLFYGQAQGTPQTQELRLNARVRLGWDPTLALVANLPTCAAALRGFRAYVVDASVVYASANVGSTVAGSGSNTAPVFCNGSNWVVG